MYHRDDPILYAPKLLDSVLNCGARKATKYISEKDVIKVTFRGRRYKGNRINTVVVTVGRPNYEERRFIKLAKAANEPFPIKKIQLKFNKIKKRKR